jgi:hypothetical protein
MSDCRFLHQLLLSLEFTGLDFAFLDQGRAHARYIQSVVVERNQAARAGVQSFGDDSVSETQLRDQRPIPYDTCTKPVLAATHVVRAVVGLEAFDYQRQE